MHLHLGSEHTLTHTHRRARASIKICFPTIRIGHGTASHGNLRVGVGRGKERREGSFMCNTLKRGGFSIFALWGGGLLTWGNICCVEIETDDSNYVQAQGLPAKMEDVKAGRMDGPRPGVAGRAVVGLERAVPRQRGPHLQRPPLLICLQSPAAPPFELKRPSPSPPAGPLERK